MSKDTYQSVTTKQVHGPGQGNLAAPALWMFFSQTTMDILNTHRQGTTHIAPEKQHHTSHPIDVFVNNTTLWANSMISELDQHNKERYQYHEADKILKTIITNTIWMLQHGEQLLWSTGGKLELTKWFFYIIHLQFKPDSTPRLSILARSQNKI